ncbi:hypothetical protein GQ54DRAFT_313333 [Martensiomyces pterosporus]|nr:hypothetical protein GQ54DRAFT_313333 [Martensiomyces pterosporus]
MEDSQRTARPGSNSHRNAGGGFPTATSSSPVSNGQAADALAREIRAAARSRSASLAGTHSNTPQGSRPLDVYSLHRQHSTSSTAHPGSASPARGTKRRAVMGDPSDSVLTGTTMLATLASISVERIPTNRSSSSGATSAGGGMIVSCVRRSSNCSSTDECPQQLQQQQHHQQQQPPLQVRPQRHHDNTLKAYSLSAQGTANSSTPSSKLTFDPRTNLPPQDITDELLSHVDREFNVVSKVVQPKNFHAEYRKGKSSAFFLLVIMANNAMYSTHPAIVALGAIRASRMLIDRAKMYVPDAIEKPSIHACLSLLLLATAYMHQGELEVSSHYSSMSLKLLQQLGVYRIDDNVWNEEDAWISESWLEREEIRRLIWGSFTVDTFLSLMLHRAPYVMVDLSGVNRPCAPHMWYIGNENIEALSFPSTAFGVAPGDSEYLAAVKQMKLGGMSWLINGNTVQVNFAVLGNALLRNLNDPSSSQEQLDKLVVAVFKSLTEWISAVPEMPSTPTVEEVQHTLLISSASICLKSVITPYLITRFYDCPSSPDSHLSLCSEISTVFGDLQSNDTQHKMLADYVSNACRVYRYTRLVIDVMKNDVPPMFIAYSMMICGGIFAACAYAAPTRPLQERFAQYTEFIKQMCRSCAQKSLLFGGSLEEIERVEEMVKFLPRRLEREQLVRIRDILIPGSIESVINKRFSTFINPIRHIAQMPPMRGLFSTEHLAPPLAARAAQPSGGSGGSTSSSSSNWGKCIRTHLDAALGAGAKSPSPSPQSPTTPGAADIAGAPLSVGPRSTGSIAQGRSRPGGIPLTSNLCAIFGKLSSTSFASICSGMRRTGAAASDASDPLRADGNTPGAPDDLFAAGNGNQDAAGMWGSPGGWSEKKVPDYKLTFTSISSLFVALSIASKDESFFDFMPELSPPSSSDALSPPIAATAGKEEEQGLGIGLRGDSQYTADGSGDTPCKYARFWHGQGDNKRPHAGDVKEQLIREQLIREQLVKEQPSRASVPSSMYSSQRHDNARMPRTASANAFSPPNSSSSLRQQASRSATMSSGSKFAPTPPAINTQQHVHDLQHNHHRNLPLSPSGTPAQAAASGAALHKVESTPASPHPPEPSSSKSSSGAKSSLIDLLN